MTISKANSIQSTRILVNKYDFINEISREIMNKSYHNFCGRQILPPVPHKPKLYSKKVFINLPTTKRPESTV